MTQQPDNTRTDRRAVPPLHEMNLSPQEASLVRRLQELGQADQPDGQFTAHLAGRLSGQYAASETFDNVPAQHYPTPWNRLRRAWRSGAWLVGAVVLVGILVLSMQLLPQGSLSVPARPDGAGPASTPAPASPAATIATQRYIVQAGDTLTSIAYTFGMTIPELMELNQIAEADVLIVGQGLMVRQPAGSSLATSTVTAPVELQPQTSSSTPAAMSISTTTSTPAAPLTPGAIPLQLVSGACSQSPDERIDLNRYPPSQRPDALAGGGLVQSGSFAIEMWLACDDAFVNTNKEGGQYSEINGLGFYVHATYQGAPQEGSLLLYVGIDPYVFEAGSSEPVQSGSTIGQIEGMRFPTGVIPDFTRSDPRLRYVTMLHTPDGSLSGAALAFTLQREDLGYRPVDISLQSLTAAELRQAEFSAAAPAPFPTLDPNVVYPQLEELRAQTEQWEAALLSSPGWLHLVVRQQETGGNGLYGSPTEWTLEDWYQIDDNATVTAFVSTQRADDGRILQQVAAHDGQTINLTFGTTYPFAPYQYKFNTDVYSSLFQALKAGDPVVRSEVDLDGRAAVEWELSIEAEDRTQREYFDRTSGARLKSELVQSHPDGQEEPIWRYTYQTIEYRSTSPTEVLALLGQESHGYIPPAPQGTPAPSGFDPTQSKLTSLTIPGDSFEQPTRFFGDVYAGDYLLGRLDFGARPGGHCARSADGSKLAYVYEVLDGDRLASATLRWLDLRQVTAVNEVAPGLILLGPPAWSPVANQIAFSACTGLVEGRFEGCGVYLYDLAVAQPRLLTTAGATAWDILWKPDGAQIAFVSTMDESHTYFILDAIAGDVLAQGVFDADAWQFPPGSPVNDWGVTFPRNYAGSRCFD